MKATRTVNWTLGNGKIAECKIEVSREVVTETAFADGWNVELGKKIQDSIYIVLTIDGVEKGHSYNAPEILNTKYDAKMVKAGAFARLGDLYLDKKSGELVIAAIAEATEEVGKDAEVIAFVESAKSTETIVVVDDGSPAEPTKRGPGWCNKCQSYCYGDCEVN